MRSLGWIACLCLLTPVLLFGDADRQDWLGEYTMNHDGHPGMLHITAAKCRMPCIGLRVQYFDERGTEYSGAVSALDDNGQHMRFTIEFPGNAQVFDVYIFSFDKNKLAGTTVWSGRTFGVMAQKVMRPNLAAVALGRPAMVHIRPEAVRVVGPGASHAQPTGTPTRSVLPDGTIQLKYPDGTVKTKKVGGCGWSTRFPDGTATNAMCMEMQVIPVVPPTPASGSAEDRWLQAQDSNLLEIIRDILGGANSTDYQNYQQAYENPPDPVLYKRIFFRTNAISELTSTTQ